MKDYTNMLPFKFNNDLMEKIVDGIRTTGKLEMPLWEEIFIDSIIKNLKPSPDFEKGLKLFSLSYEEYIKMAVDGSLVYKLPHINEFLEIFPTLKPWFDKQNLLTPVNHQEFLSWYYTENQKFKNNQKSSITKEDFIKFHKYQTNKLLVLLRDKDISQIEKEKFIFPPTILLGVYNLLNETEQFWEPTSLRDFISSFDLNNPIKLKVKNRTAFVKLLSYMNSKVNSVEINDTIADKCFGIKNFRQAKARGSEPGDKIVNKYKRDFKEIFERNKK